MAIWEDGSIQPMEDLRQSVRAAEYVRMSTDHQRYSTANQSKAIHDYAALRGFAIVRTYADEGKSGLNIDGRDALKRLIDDVTSEQTDFAAILVYDVSRWGRFQDADESAYYEYICRRAGIAVHYCAEQFENDGSPVSTIVKGLKRAMAGEYSRELSAKVFAGQSRLVERGYRLGATAGLGLRRKLIDENGVSKGILERGQKKSIFTDRVVLVPGPEAEVEIVREIFSMFVHERLSEQQIADRLNERGILNDRGRPWWAQTVKNLLTSEKYIGHSVWNRTSFKLKKRLVHNDPEMWIRVDQAFPAIVDPALFEAAQTIMQRRTCNLSNEELIEGLRALYARHGRLSGIIINEDSEVPSSATYRSRFGSLVRAYRLVGFSPRRAVIFHEINCALRRLHPAIVEEIVAGLSAVGATVAEVEGGCLLLVNDELAVSVVIARCRRTPSGKLHWQIRFDANHKPDITVAVRMDAANARVLDYYLFPRIDQVSEAVRLAQDNALALDAYRFDSLDALYRLAERTAIAEAA